MALTVPYDRPIVPIVLYDPQAPPVILQLNLPPELQQYIPYATVQVLNKAGISTSMNVGRMYYYNLLVENNFCNEELPNAVGDTIMTASLNTSRGMAPNLSSAIVDAADYILTLRASRVIMREHQLKPLLSAAAVHAASQNVAVFNNLEQELDSMSYPPSPYYPPQAAHYQPPVHHAPAGHPQPGYGHPPAGYYPPPGYPAPQTVAYPQPGYDPRYPPPQHGHPQAGYQPPRAGHQYQPLERTQSHQALQEAAVQTIGGNTARAAASQGRFVQHRARFAPNQEVHTDVYQGTETRTYQYRAEQPAPAPAPVPLAPVAAPAPATAVASQLTLSEGNDMERGEHSVVYFGEVVSEKPGERHAQYRENTEELRKTTIANEDSTVLKADIIREVSLDSLTLAARLHFLSSRKDDDTRRVYRIFGRVADPYIAVVGLESVQKVLRQTTTLQRIADRLHALVKELAKKAPEIRTALDTDTLAYLSKFDRELTSRINDYLKNNLQTGLAVTSFAEDFSEVGLEMDRNKKYGPRVRSEWERWCVNFANRLLDGLNDAEASTPVTESFTTDGYFVATIPKAISITYIDLTLAELGYKIKDGSAVIQPKVAPVLYDLVKSIRTHRNAVDFDTDADYLLTADGARYRFYQNFLAPETEEGPSFTIAAN